VTDVIEKVYEAPIWGIEDYWFGEPIKPFNQGEKFYDMIKD